MIEQPFESLTPLVASPGVFIRSACHGRLSSRQEMAVNVRKSTDEYSRFPRCQGVALLRTLPPGCSQGAGRHNAIKVAFDAAREVANCVGFDSPRATRGGTV